MFNRDNAELKPRHFNATTTHEHGFDAQTTTAVTVRLRRSERKLKGRKLVRHLTAAGDLPELGGHCYCEHDCCGHPVYGASRIVWRKRSEVRVKFTSSPNY